MAVSYLIVEVRAARPHLVVGAGVVLSSRMRDRNAALCSALLQKSTVVPSPSWQIIVLRDVVNQMATQNRRRFSFVFSPGG